MQPRPILARTVLTRTRVPGFEYCVNPYVGCAHGCRYCYASFMKRFTGHAEPWGEFVDVKTNAPEVLRRQLRRARRGSVLVGTVTDLPARRAAWARDARVRRGPAGAAVGRRAPDALPALPARRRPVPPLRVDLRRPLDHDRSRADPEAARAARPAHHRAGVTTYAFVGPLLPMDPARLVAQLGDAADSVEHVPVLRQLGP